MVSRMKLYARENNWRQVAADIETEFRSEDLSQITLSYYLSFQLQEDRQDQFKNQSSIHGRGDW